MITIIIVVAVPLIIVGVIIYLAINQVLKSKDDVDLKMNVRKGELNIKKGKQ